MITSLRYYDIAADTLHHHHHHFTSSSPLINIIEPAQECNECSEMNGSEDKNAGRNAERECEEIA